MVTEYNPQRIAGYRIYQVAFQDYPITVQPWFILETNFHGFSGEISSQRMIAGGFETKQEAEQWLLVKEQ